MPKVYVVGGDMSVVKMFINAGFLTVTQLDTARKEDFDLLCFTGGEDISPYLYGQEVSGAYGMNEARDIFEIAIYREFIDKPKVGICRGGQLMNILNGGSMIQDIEGHSWGNYQVKTYGEEPQTYITKEDHHQGMVLPDNWWESNVWPLLWDTRDQNLEAVFYTKTRDLCFQAHPEWGHDETKNLFFNLMETHLNLKGD